ncbi:MAG: DNA replication/repair protein RecF, partial [Nannocystaceae bacterium]
MELRELQLAQYRNLAEATLPLDARFTVIWGENGAGKTNLLEALYLISTFRSFRSSDQRVLLRAGHREALAKLTAFDPQLGLPSTFEVRIVQHERSTRKTGTVDGKRVAAAKDFYGRVRAILFTPEDLGMLRGSPSGRRQFLDRVIFAQDRAHIGDIQDYEKTVRSRNKVLKAQAGTHAGSQAPLLDSYDQGIAEIGARIWRRRAAVIE